MIGRFLATALGSWLLAGAPVLAQCTSIENKICSIGSYNYSHVPGQAYVSPPLCTASNPVQPATKQKIQSAFSRLPPDIKNEICSLKRIYVDPGNVSWGLWENIASDEYPTDGLEPGSYIGIASNSLNDSIQDHEKNLVKRAFRGNLGGLQFDYVFSGPATEPSLGSELTIASILLHELGHIKWHQNKNTFLQSSCFRSAFIDTSWLQSTIGESLRSTWTDMDASKGAKHKPGTKHPHDGNLTADEFRDLYGNAAGTKGFASAVGSITPEEDFVEVLKLAAFRTMQQNTNFSLSLTISNTTGGSTSIDVINNRVSAVEAKLTCLQNLYGMSPLLLFR